MIELAVENYNNFNFERGNYADEKSSDEFLNRICVNFLRHELTNYDCELQEIRGKTGKDISHKIIKNKVLKIIEDVYPSLKTECERQKL